MNFKTFGALCVIASALIFATVAYHNSQKSQVPIIFSSKDILATTWRHYKENYIDPSGRTVDHENNNVTTSEGESYTMLRAVWMDDQSIFDTSWKWTHENLTRSDGHIFSWLFGQRVDGTYGVLSDRGGQNSASDADSDIALALLFAYSRWQDPTYLSTAKDIINDIWKTEVVIINGRPYLAANNLEKNLSSPTVVINPSYFAPYAYKVFSKVDPNHPWSQLVDTSYEVLKTSMNEKLDKFQTVGLPPDWILINRITGLIEAGKSDNLSSNFTFDAMRIPWRIALDWEWNQDSRAKEVLKNMTFLENQWNNKKKIFAGYTHDGQIINDFETPAIYGGSIGYFLVTDVKNANSIYVTKLQSLYNPDTNSWKEELSYYDDNWAWFGLALYNNFLPNLSQATLSQK
jgi:endo-1,4-beta-D-glucanase Y